MEWKWAVLGGGLLLAACGVKAPPRPVVPTGGAAAPAAPGQAQPEEGAGVQAGPSR